MYSDASNQIRDFFTRYHFPLVNLYMDKIFNQISMFEMTSNRLLFFL